MRDIYYEILLFIYPNFLERSLCYCLGKGVGPKTVNKISKFQFSQSVNLIFSPCIIFNRWFMIFMKYIKCE